MLPRRVLALAVVAVACRDSPTAPSPTYPQVAGTYSADVNLFRIGEGISKILGTLTATVVQVGNQVAITTNITGRITRTRPPIRGTISDRGGLAVMAGGQPFRDPDCGEILPTSTTIVFGPDVLIYLEDATSQDCGNVRVEAVLVRQ